MNLPPNNRESSPRAQAAHLRAQLDSLAVMAGDLAGQFKLEPLLARILRHTLELLDCNTGSICTVDEVAGIYRKEVDLGVGCRSGQTFPLNEGVTGEIVRARKAVIFSAYADVHGGHISPEERDALHGVLGVPIRWNGSIIGACIVFSRDPDRMFTDEDVSLVELFATHAAIAITNARLHASEAERRSEAAVVAERERVLRDVHDSVSRGLASILLYLDRAEHAVSTGRDPHDGFHRARQAAQSALVETRRTVLGLGPTALNGRPLSEAVSLELSWVESTTEIETQLVIVGEPQPLPPGITRQLFRIVQEALTNAVQHADARNIRVGLIYGSATVSAHVEDDGRGFDVNEIENKRGARAGAYGLGIEGLIERAHHMGGIASVDSVPGWGTRVRAELPYSGGNTTASRSRWRVLIIHENAIVRSGLVRMLDAVEPDIQVVGELSESSQVVEAYEMLQPHVVIAQLGMSHIDGISITSYLRAADEHAAVVLMIDPVTQYRVHDAAQVGAIGFIEHDIDAASLARSIVAAARGDSVMKAEIFGRFTKSQNEATQGGQLTTREAQVRGLVEQGLQDKQIATQLGISVKTVEKHVGAVLRKTGAPNRTALARLSLPRG
jgi:signal transduction histidine kinase/DNA-binding NarL/FixJ family response regulator